MRDVGGEMRRARLGGEPFWFGWDWWISAVCCPASGLPADAAAVGARASIVAVVRAVIVAGVEVRDGTVAGVRGVIAAGVEVLAATAVGVEVLGGIVAGVEVLAATVAGVEVLGVIAAVALVTDAIVAVAPVTDAIAAAVRATGATVAGALAGSVAVAGVQAGFVAVQAGFGGARSGCPDRGVPAGFPVRGAADLRVDRLPACRVGLRVALRVGRGAAGRR